MLVDSDHHIHCVADLSIVVIFHQVVMCHRNIRVRVLLNKINLQVLFIVCFVYISCKIIIMYRPLVAERGPTENKTLHSQVFCNKLRTSWSVTLQNSRSFVCTI